MSKNKLWFKTLNNFATGGLPNGCIWIQISGFCKARHVQAETGMESNQNTGYSTNIKNLPALCVGYSKVAWSLQTSASYNPEHPSMTQPAGEATWQPAGCTHALESSICYLLGLLRGCPHLGIQNITRGPIFKQLNQAKYIDECVEIVFVPTLHLKLYSDIIFVNANLQFFGG